MTMPRRFFTSLADRYNRLRPEPDTPEYELWTKMVAGTVTVIEGEWQSFRRDRFFEGVAGKKPTAENRPKGPARISAPASSAR